MLKLQGNPHFLFTFTFLTVLCFCKLSPVKSNAIVLIELSLPNETDPSSSEVLLNNKLLRGSESAWKATGEEETQTPKVTTRSLVEEVGTPQENVPGDYYAGGKRRKVKGKPKLAYSLTNSTISGSQANFVIWLANNGTGVLQVLLTLPEYAESDLSSFKLNRNETISVQIRVDHKAASSTIPVLLIKSNGGSGSLNLTIPSGGSKLSSNKSTPKKVPGPTFPPPASNSSQLDSNADVANGGNATSSTKPLSGSNSEGTGEGDDDEEEEVQSEGSEKDSPSSKSKSDYYGEAGDSTTGGTAQSEEKDSLDSEEDQEEGEDQAQKSTSTAQKTENLTNLTQSEGKNPKENQTSGKFPPQSRNGYGEKVQNKTSPPEAKSSSSPPPAENEQPENEKSESPPPPVPTSPNSPDEDENSSETEAQSPSVSPLLPPPSQKAPPEKEVSSNEGGRSVWENFVGLVKTIWRWLAANLSLEQIMFGGMAVIALVIILLLYCCCTCCTLWKSSKRGASGGPKYAPVEASPQDPPKGRKSEGWTSEWDNSGWEEVEKEEFEGVQMGEGRVEKEKETDSLLGSFSISSKPFKAPPSPTTTGRKGPSSGGLGGKKKGTLVVSSGSTSNPGTPKASGKKKTSKLVVSRGKPTIGDGWEDEWL